jgi:hypothetical protein
MSVDAIITSTSVIANSRRSGKRILLPLVE